MKRELLTRGFAAAVTIGFMAAVRPDAEPERWSVALVSVMLYEGIRWSADYIWKINQKTKQKKYITLNLKARKADAERLEGVVFNPFKNVGYTEVS